MREIKFRAWNKETKKMLRDGWYDDLELGQDMATYYDIFLMQYTGLKDKNGVEIYEGDIVTIIDFSDPEMRTFMAKIEFFKAHYSLKVIKGSVDFGRIGLGSFDSGEDDIEVIGNIYENHELLEIK